MNKIYKKIKDKDELEEITTSSRILKKEDIEMDLKMEKDRSEMAKREIELSQTKIQELENLLTKLK